VPESAPGPNSFIGWSGQAGFTWFQRVTLPCAPGSHIFFSSATVSCLMKLFLGLITTVSASNATGSSKYSMPAFWQSAISAFRIGREAFEMSVSPRQNFLKPPPVPEMPTVTLTCCFFAFWKSSATASVTGNTVLEPSILTMRCWARAGAATSAALRATTGRIFMPRRLRSQHYRFVTARGKA
jgi:hypothetical protein